MTEQFKIYDKQEPTYIEAKQFIGGYVQSVPLENGDRLLCDEEGKLKDFHTIPRHRNIGTRVMVRILITW